MIGRPKSRIERKNIEQRATITKLCKDLSLDSTVGDFGSAISRNSLRFPIHRDETHIRIRQLEAELELKRQEYSALSQKLEQYLAIASAGDQETKRRQAEKTAMIAALQQPDFDERSTLTVAHLDYDTHTKQGEFERRDDETHHLFLAARERLKNSHDKTKELHQELLRLQSQLNELPGRSAQLEQIRLNDATITRHQTTLKKLKLDIRSLTEANILLKKLITDDESNTD
jgi:hypothetical protein